MKNCLKLSPRYALSHCANRYTAIGPNSYYNALLLSQIQYYYYYGLCFYKNLFVCLIFVGRTDVVRNILIAAGVVFAILFFVTIFIISIKRFKGMFWKLHFSRLNTSAVHVTYSSPYWSTGCIVTHWSIFSKWFANATIFYINTFNFF